MAADSDTPTTIWLSEDSWTGSDPTPEELKTVARWRFQARQWDRLRALGLRLEPRPKHPFWDGQPGRHARLVGVTHDRRWY